MELLFEQLIYYICYLAFFILAFGVLLAIYPFDDACSKTMILRRRLVGVLAVIFALGIIWVRFAEPSLLLTKRYDLSALGQTQKIKIAVASDFHYGVFKNAPNLKRIVEKINKENPDLVFLPGDFVYQAPKTTIEGMFSELKNLKVPVFTVWGNHDVGLLGEIDDKQELKAELGKYATMLENEQTQVVVNGKTINLLGLGDLREGKTDFQKLQTLKVGDFNLVLVHNPDAVHYFPKNLPVNLVISGHTHAGQIRVPFLYKTYLPSDFGIEKGVYTIGGIKTLVTSGIGVSILPFRFLVPPEIMFVEI